MYPFIRLFKETLKFRHAPRLPILGVHVSQHRCWPVDLDPWVELNNGRTLTIYDLGRIPLSMRLGFDLVARQNGWGITVAGNMTRYRRRVRAFDRLEMRSAVIGWDARFFYVGQSLWCRGECTSQMLLRNAFTAKGGMVPPATVLRAMGLAVESPALPAWVQGWIAAESARPWPPLT